MIKLQNTQKHVVDMIREQIIFGIQRVDEIVFC